MSRRRVEAAAADDDTDRVYKGSHIGCRLIHQINKMDVPLELDTAYRLLSSPGLTSRDSLLPTGPEIIADLHQALRDKTLAPCPPPAENEADEIAEQSVPEKDLPQLPPARESKKPRRQTAKAARKNQHLLRKKLRQEKHLFQEKNLFQNFSAGQECQVPPDPPETSVIQAPAPDANVANVERDPQGGESQSAAPPAVQEFTPPAYASLPESAAPPAAVASPPATASANKRDKSATDAKRQRRLLRKMLRNQKHISKAKKLVQNLTPAHRGSPSSLRFLSKLKTRNSKLSSRNPKFPFRKPIF